MLEERVRFADHRECFDDVICELDFGVVEVA